MRLLADCKAKKIDFIITKSISRFARNTLDCLKYIRMLKDKNIPVFFEKESINTMDAKGEVLLTIMASLAQQESQSLSQNVKMGLQFRYQNGQVPGKRNGGRAPSTRFSVTRNILVMHFCKRPIPQIFLTKPELRTTALFRNIMLRIITRRLFRRIFSYGCKKNLYAGVW